MRRRKNKKRIDPRHFLSETTFRSDPGATLPRPALLQAIAVAVSRGDLKTAYELLASVSTEEALAIIEQGIEDVLGITIQIEDDEDADEEFVREAVQPVADKATYAGSAPAASWLKEIIQEEIELILTDDEASELFGNYMSENIGDEE
jgi:hypothetical protein